MEVTEGDADEGVNGTLLLPRHCGDTNKPIVVTSKGNALTLTLHAVEDLTPKRGFQAHWKGEENCRV